MSFVQAFLYIFRHQLVSFRGDLKREKIARSSIYVVDAFRHSVGCEMVQSRCPLSSDIHSVELDQITDIASSLKQYILTSPSSLPLHMRLSLSPMHVTGPA